MRNGELLVFLGAFTAAATSGCKQESSAPRASAASTIAIPPASATPPEVLVPQPPATNTREELPALKVGISWDDPKAWTRLNRPSPMRAATYKIPQADPSKGAAEVAVFYFGAGQGGDIDGNVARWAGQFGKTLNDVKRTNREANGIKQHVVEIDEGEFKNDMMGQSGKSMKGWAMLAAIVEAPSGSYFFKMTGPKADVDAQRAAFNELLDSIKPREP